MYVLHTIYDLIIQFYAINPIKHTFSKIQQIHVCCFVFREKQGRLPVRLAAHQLGRWCPRLSRDDPATYSVFIFVY